MKRILSILLVVSMLFVFCACDYNIVIDTATIQNFIKTIRGEQIVEDLGEDTIKIGVFEPQSGKYYLDAEDEIKGIELAYKLFPEINGKKIELVYADNRSDVSYAPQAAQELIDNGCKIVIGSHSNVLTMAAMDVFEENHVLCFCPSCTNPLITTTTDYVYRVAIVDAFQGNSAAKYIIEHMPEIVHPAVPDNPYTEEDESEAAGETVKCVILKRSDDEKASALIERFQNKMESSFGADGYAKVIEYSASATDLTVTFERLIEAGAEVVYFPSNATDGERVLYEAYERGYDFEWIGSSEWVGLQDAANNAGHLDQGHLEGVSYVSEFDKDATSTQTTTIFMSAVRDYYKIATPSEDMALGFDAYLLALEAIRTASNYTHGESLEFAASRFYEVSCATGSITYRAGNGDPVKDVIIERIQNGKVKVEYTASPVWQ